MKKKKTISNAPFIFCFVTIAVFSVCLFAVRSPSLNSRFFPARQTAKWHALSNSIQSTKDIDAKTFWEFRDFYSRGTYTFSKTGISPELLSEDMKHITAELTENLPFLYFSSPSLESVDILIDENDLTTILLPLQNTQTVLSTKSVVLSEQNGSSILIFVKPLEQMKQANGYFDYNDRDKEFVEGTAWLNISIISPRLP